MTRINDNTPSVVDPIEKLIRQIRRSSVFEDRLEYSIEDFASAYGITEEQARFVQAKLHRLVKNPIYTPF